MHLILSTVALLALVAPALCKCGEVQQITWCGSPSGPVYAIDPDTGEICFKPSCGGGISPPKTDVPGCSMYTGAETVSYLSCWTPQPPEVVIRTEYGTGTLTRTASPTKTPTPGSGTYTGPLPTISAENSCQKCTKGGEGEGETYYGEATALAQSESTGSQSKTLSSSSLTSTSSTGLAAANAQATGSWVGVVMGAAMGAAALL